MAQPVTDYAAFFAGAKQAVEELEQLKQSEETLEKKEKEIEGALKEKKKQIAESISQTVKKRAAEIAKSYDDETDKAKDRLKKVRAKREKARNQGIKERIAEETRGLISLNEELRLQMKTLFQEKHVPGFCSSHCYYTLYFTRGIKETGILLLTLLSCFLLAPCGIYLLIPERRTWHLFLIYMVLIVLLGGLYVRIGNRTKLRYMETLREGRSILDMRLANRRKIRAIARAVRRDKNDTLYNLQKFDDEIAQLTQDLAQLAKKKKDALNTFDTVTKTILSDEITESHRPELQRLEEELSQTAERLSAVKNSLKEKSFMASDRYVTYVGRENMTPERLAALEGLLSEGQASNISEAVTKLRDGCQGTCASL
ncbi:MAG: hypothetical protein HFE83_04990 [Lachnospiraceae bacterium]|nr:hypothetical protein [Lachnospiraceae bacterium]